MRTDEARTLDASIYPILKHSIDNFADQSVHNIEQVERMMAELSDKVARIGEILSQRLDQANIMLSNANMELNICEIQPPYYNPDTDDYERPSCDSERHDVRIAQEQVKSAERCESQYNEVLRTIKQRENEYYTHKDRFMRMVDGVLREGSAIALRQWQNAEAYIGESVSCSEPICTEIEEELHPILQPFGPSVKDLLLAFGKIDEMWQDNAAEIFKEEIAKKWENETRAYLDALLYLEITYEGAVEYCNNLLSDRAGVGSWINIYQAEMLVKRKISRLITGRDDYRW